MTTRQHPNPTAAERVAQQEAALRLAPLSSGTLSPAHHDKVAWTVIDKRTGKPLPAKGEPIVSQNYYPALAAALVIYGKDRDEIDVVASDVQAGTT